MSLKLYNTLGRKKQSFKPLKNKEVRMYSCGLTVYDYGHIGNYRAFVVSDILRRYLEFKGYRVKKIMNITDVDDKTIRNSIKNNQSLKEFTQKFEKAFFEDEKMLNIKQSSYYPRATEHIKEMIVIIEILLKKGFAYKTNDGIYFNIRKFKDYGKLSGINLENLKEGASERISKDEYDKENVKDFALWKFYDAEDGDVYWETKFGKGRPGWHIECSAMSEKYLGQPFDIHTGGVDLIFPHHENEIAQSQASKNKKLANFWIHNEWITVNGKKMSKSLGNFYTLRDIIKAGYDPLSLKYFYLTGHYRGQINFTIKNLKNAENSLKRLRNIIEELKDDKKINRKYLGKFEKVMDDDLDTTKAIEVLWELVRNEKANGKIQTIQKIDEVLGLELLKKEKDFIPEEIKKLVEEREKARRNKDFKKADEIREKIRKLGYKIDDTNEGNKVRKL
ncbi:cysteine--tRNA ligase [Candidatus Pacearchaeota archaeon]|nr:cysteine--tRNA ligase [Candidatus Pacearchaeota archaeon]